MSTKRFAASFADAVKLYWTPERLGALCSGKDFPLSPEKPGAAQLLRVLGLIGGDGRIGSEVVRKFKQVNYLVLEIEHALSAHIAQPTKRPMRIIELAAGRSHVSLLLAHSASQRWERPAHILAVDRDPQRVTMAEERAHTLGFSDAIRHRTCAIGELQDWSHEYACAFPGADASGPPHCAVALHACDTASDEALALAVRSRAAVIACAPCCHSELSRKWAGLPIRQADGRHPLGLIHRMPNLRAETAATITDAMRIALLRSSGYAVEASEFVAPEHTPKNRLIIATRLPARNEGADEDAARQAARLRSTLRRAGREEYTSLKQATGGEGIALEALLGLDGDS